MNFIFLLFASSTAFSLKNRLHLSLFYKEKSSLITQNLNSQLLMSKKDNNDIKNNWVMYKKFNEIFTKQNKQKEIENQLNDLMLTSKNELHPGNIGMLIHRCAKNKIDINKIISLNEILMIAENPNNSYKFSAIDIAQICYGMKLLNINSPGVKEFLTFITKQLEDEIIMLNGQQIGNILYGLQNMDSFNPFVPKLLKTLIKKFDNTSIKMKSQEISNAFYGLRKMSSETAEVPLIIENLKTQILISEPNFSPICISGVLNGLQGCTGKNPEVLDLLNSIIPYILKINEVFDERVIGSCLMGFRSMTAESAEVRQILRIFISQISQSKQKFNLISLTSAINGLRSMNDDKPEVREILGLLSKKLEISDVLDLPPKNVGNMLLGFQSMKNNSPEFRYLIAAIAYKILRDSPQEFRSVDIALSFYGLQNIKLEKCPEVRVILGKLSERLENNVVLMSSKHLGYSLYGLKSLASENIPEVNRVLRILAKKAESIDDNLKGQILGMSMLGLSGCKSERPEIKSILSIITKKLPKTQVKNVLDPQACGNILYSLHKMSTKEIEVRRFLKSFSPLISGFNTPMSGHELSNGFFGLQEFDSRYEETIDVLKALSVKLKQNLDEKIYFNAHGLGNALFGLQTMSDQDDPVINEILGFLADHVEFCSETLKPYDIANALFGLQGMTSESEGVRAVMSALNIKMKEIAYNPEFKFTPRDVGYSLSGLNGMQRFLYPDIDEFLEMINLKVAQSGFADQRQLFVLQFGKGVRVKAGDDVSNAIKVK